MSGFKIDFFELLFLAEVCIPPKPIARSVFFDNLSDKYYHQMSNDERVRFFEFLSPKLNMRNDDCQHFYARFNPKNQYLVKTTYNGKTEEMIVYSFNDKYHISKDSSINEDYIDSVLILQK